MIVRNFISISINKTKTIRSSTLALASSEILANLSHACLCKTVEVLTCLEAESTTCHVVICSCHANDIVSWWYEMPLRDVPQTRCLPYSKDDNRRHPYSWQLKEWTKPVNSNIYQWHLVSYLQLVGMEADRFWDLLCVASTMKGLGNGCLERNLVSSPLVLYTFSTLLGICAFEKGFSQDSLISFSKDGIQLSHKGGSCSALTSSYTLSDWDGWGWLTVRSITQAILSIRWE